MTKEELLRALEPFTDEVEIAIGEDGGFSAVKGYAYGISPNGNGWLILDRGERVMLPRIARARMETAVEQPKCNGLCRGHNTELSTAGWLPDVNCPVHGLKAMLTTSNRGEDHHGND